MSQPWDISITAPDGGPVRLAGKATGEPSGGSLPGVSRVLMFSWTFDTPGFADGVEFYTPAVDDVLVGYAFFTTTVFDGTAAKADFGAFLSGDLGLGRLATVSPSGYNLKSNTPADPYDTIGNSGPGIGEFGFILPFLTVDPLKIVVSEDGIKGSAAIDSTQGGFRLYLQVATPDDV